MRPDSAPRQLAKALRPQSKLSHGDRNRNRFRTLGLSFNVSLAYSNEQRRHYVTFYEPIERKNTDGNSNDAAAGEGL